MEVSLEIHRLYVHSLLFLINVRNEFKRIRFKILKSIIYYLLPEYAELHIINLEIECFT